MEEACKVFPSAAGCDPIMVTASRLSEHPQIMCQKLFDTLANPYANKCLAWILAVCLRQEQDMGINNSHSQCFFFQKSSDLPCLFPVVVKVTQKTSGTVPCVIISLSYLYNVRRLLLLVSQVCPLPSSSSTSLLMPVTRINFRNPCPSQGHDGRRHSGVERSQKIHVDHSPSTKHTNGCCAVCFYLGHTGQRF